MNKAKTLLSTCLHLSHPCPLPLPSLSLPPLPPPSPSLLQITHPAGCFTQFLQFFGPQIFILWKLALLKKRIILFSPPPIGVVCYRGMELLSELIF